MSNQTKKILIEVDESRETVLSMYGELQEKVGKLAEGNMKSEFEEMKKLKQVTDDIEIYEGKNVKDEIHL
ncbi:hypothetical protein [Enterococcus faecium]|uniref:hypothetical protein n=1 Tax=Enterococcus faecium TaxID=1352 RepID=UPI0011981FAB|nr:hypothetical protein [Enterococcus faecium]